MADRKIIKLPKIGFGTSEFISNDDVVSCVNAALEYGYRLIDTSPIYGSEEGIGIAVKNFVDKYNIKREEILISSKISNDDQGYFSTKDAVNRSLEKIKFDYIDLVLIHWPIPKNHEKDYKDLNLETWAALIEMKNAGFIREIGVCNFLERHIVNLIDNTGIRPFVNQLEIHPRYQQFDIVNYCKENDIAVEAWCPFRHGKIFNEKILAELAFKYKVSIADLCLNWCIQRGVIPLPKAHKIDAIKKNFEISENTFIINDNDIKVIESMNEIDGHEDYWNYRRQQLY